MNPEQFVGRCYVMSVQWISRENPGLYKRMTAALGGLLKFYEARWHDAFK